MKFFQNKKLKNSLLFNKNLATAVPTTSSKHSFSFIGNYVPLSISEMSLYDSLRESVPIIDAAIRKIVMLVGEFRIKHNNPYTEALINNFLKNIRVNSFSCGINSFISTHLEQLLTYGTAIGEIVMDPDLIDIYALYNSSLRDVELKTTDNPLVTNICIRDSLNKLSPVQYPDLLLLSTLNPKPKNPYGESILKGLPFVTDILLKIYNSIGRNWERVGNVRFAVTYKPNDDFSEQSWATTRAQTIASEWSKAINSPDGSVSDFVAIGDVDIKVIGADNQILDSKIPVRQMLEQIIAKLSIPPFLLGLSWSTTERMSSQQADILTSELDSFRRTLNPIISKICSLWLKLHAFDPSFSVEWNNINLQDEVELSKARLQNAMAHQTELKNQKEVASLNSINSINSNAKGN